MAKRTTTSLQNISDKSKEIAAMAGDAIGQAALRVTHMALKRARAVVASADEAIYPAKRRKAKTAKKKVVAKAVAITRKAKSNGKAIVKKAKKAARAPAKKAKKIARKRR